MKNIIVIGVVGILLLAGWFYWFQYRPSQIKQDCISKIQNQFKGKDVSTISINQVISLRGMVYQECLHEKGL